MNDTDFCSLMRWSVAGFREGRVTHVMLSNGTDRVGINEQLKVDILAALERAREEARAELEAGKVEQLRRQGAA